MSMSEVWPTSHSAVYHGCTLGQAVVMVTTVLIGSGHFWTAGNKKKPKLIVTKFCTGDYVGLVNQCAHFGSYRLPGDFSTHA